MMRGRAWCVLGVLALIAGGACSGGDDDDGPAATAPTSHHDGGTKVKECVDADGDGWGDNCDLGDDCDDDDPEVTDECRRCRTENKGCPCEPGTKPLHCDPEDLHTVQN